MPYLFHSIYRFGNRSRGLLLAIFVRNWNSPEVVYSFVFTWLGLMFISWNLFFFFLRMKFIHSVNIYWAPQFIRLFVRSWDKISKVPFSSLPSLVLTKQINLAWHRSFSLWVTILARNQPGISSPRMFAKTRSFLQDSLTTHFSLSTLKITPLASVTELPISMFIENFCMEF
jgi:hypothetical protein